MNLVNYEEIAPDQLYSAMEISDWFGLLMMANLAVEKKMAVQDFIPQSTQGALAIMELARNVEGYSEAFIAFIGARAGKGEIPAFSKPSNIRNFKLNPFISEDNGEYFYYRAKDILESAQQSLGDMLRVYKEGGYFLSDARKEQVTEAFSWALKTAFQRVLPALVDDMVICNGYKEPGAPSPRRGP